MKQKVWEAICDALHREGCADIRAGLAWINDDVAARVAEAAIAAMQEPTKEMIAAGCAAEDAGPSGDPAALRASNRYATMAEKYRAMIRAAASSSSPSQAGEKIDTRQFPAIN